MRFYRHRSNYWSCSDFASWVLSLVDVVKPQAETSEGWKCWRNLTLSAHPVVYTLVEEWLDALQDIVMFPYDVYDSIRTYIRNRFITKTHLIPTGLVPGEWHETDERMLHGMFELLVDFIEIEKAHMHRWCKPSTEKPWYLKWRFLRWGEHRSVEDGLAYLDWEMKLVEQDGEHFTHQAQAAETQYELYNWWKNIRPNRPDPYEVTGWNALNDTLPDIMCWDATNNSEERRQLNLLSLKVHELEERWEKEDEEMLLKLVKIRRSLWT